MCIRDRVTARPVMSATGHQLLKDWDRINGLLDSYWYVFHRLYLLSLREIHLVRHPVKKGMSPFTPSVGDIVLVEEVAKPRACWKFGRIENLDKRQALATLRSDGQLKLRLIRQLYPLEVNCERLPVMSDSAAPLSPVAGSSSAP